MSASEAELLVGEAYHRVFNGLQLIVASTSGILLGALDPGERERLRDLQERVDTWPRSTGACPDPSVPMPRRGRHWPGSAPASPPRSAAPRRW